MPRVTVDFSEVQEFSALEKGEYAAIIDEVEYREAEQYGKEHDSLEWRLTYTEGEAKGRKAWFYTSMSPKALWRMKQVFENLGFADEEIELEVDEDTNLVTSPELSGLPVVAVVTVGTYEGRTTNNIDTLLSPDDVPVKGKGDVPAKRGAAKKDTAKSSAKKSTGAKAGSRPSGGRKFK